MLTFDPQMYVYHSALSSPVSDGAGVAAAVGQLWPPQSEAEVSSMQSIRPHGRAPAVTLVLALNIFSSSSQQVHSFGTEIPASPRHCGIVLGREARVQAG